MGKGFKVWRVTGGSTGAAPTEYGETVADTDIARGDALTMSSGYLQPAGAAAGTVVGVALEDITGESGVNKKIAFVPAFESVLFSAECSGSPAVTTRYTTVDIEGGTGAQQINEDATSNPVFRILGLEDGYSWGDSNARVYGVFSATGFSGRS